MGAALTYARRYALFTMVGIAGEDDLDAPDIATEEPNGGRAEHPGPIDGSSSRPTPAHPTQSRTGTLANPPVRQKLSAEEPAAAKLQLIQEIQTLPEGDLEARAIAILKAKNRLTADDAKQIEEAFAARMAPQDASPEAPEEPASAPIKLQSLLLSKDAVKPPRGRPRKVKTASDHSAAPPVVPQSTTNDAPSASIHLQAEAAPAKIDKSQRTFGEPRRLRDKAHLKFVASQPCLICGRSPADAHHLRFTQPRAMGLKVSDEFTVPLCRTHHRDIHSVGDEVAWWEQRAIDPVTTSRVPWVSTRRIG